MAIWPASLPQNIMVDGFEGGVAKNKIRTEMEVGPPKQRRRTTANSAPFSGSLIMTKAQVDALRTFHDDTLEAGALSFDWVDPVDDATKSFRFVTEPTWQGIGPEYFRVNLNLELMP